MAKSKQKVINVAVLGLGRIGWDHHVKTLLTNPAFKITACADLLPERREQARQEVGCAVFTTQDEMLDAKLADLMIVATRSIDHFPHTMKALKAGLHVVCEKPFAMNTRQADQMIAAAKKAKRVLTVHQSFRISEGHRFVREVIDSGILGKVFWIRFTQHSFFRRNDWQQLKKYGGGFLYNNGAHSVDSALFLLDSPVKDVWGELKHTVTAGDGDDWLKVMIRGENRRVIEVEQSYACAVPHPGWLVAGTCGTMAVSGKEATIKYFDPKAVKPIKVIDAAPAGRRYGNDDKLPWQEKVVPVQPSTPNPSFYDALAASILRGKKPLITPESVREQIRVINLIQKDSDWQA